MSQQQTGRVNAQDKRIFGGETDVNQLIPLRYTWAWEAYLAANKNHWLPGHFHVQEENTFGTYGDPDDSNARLVLELYFGWRLATASAIRESLACLYRATTAPECRQYILRHMQEESVAIAAITQSGYLDLPNMGLWVDSQAMRVAEQFPTDLTMLAHDYSVTVSAMLVYKAYAFTALETWLMKECQLPTETRKLVQALQRDTVGQRNFYTNLLSTFLVENPKQRELVKAATQDTATTAAINCFYLHWFKHDLTQLNSMDRPRQFAEHCWTNTLTKLGIPVKTVNSPYEQQASTKQAAPVETSALSWD